MSKTYSFAVRPPKILKAFNKPSKTVLGLENDVNINQIVARAKRNQAVPISMKSPVFGDFSQTPDYQSLLNRVMQIRSEFMSLPAKTREKFGNSEADFYNYINNPENHDEAVKLGILEKKAVKASPEPVKPPEDPGAKTA